MAMSLEDLLSKEGFKRRKAKMMSRSSFAVEGRTVPLYAQRGNEESSSLPGVKRTERTRSDVARYDSNGEFSASSSFVMSKPRDNLSRMGKIEQETKASSSRNDARGRRDSWDGQRSNVDSFEDIREPEITELVQNNEIVEVGRRSTYKDVYLNKVYADEGNDGNRSVRRMSIDNKTRNNSLKVYDNRNNSLKGYDNKSNSGYEDNKVISEDRKVRQMKLEEALATPALDEAALKAVISIFSGYIRRFMKDEEFRTSLRHNSFASLNFTGYDEGLSTESKVLENLEQAIEIAERAVEEMATSKELKRASLQLSVITGLNSSDLKDGFTSGIPNYKLSACAHLYLSVIYMLQKKNGIAAKHVLQVFCDSPFQARLTLLPDLWENMFLPHLSHLKLWYEKESSSSTDSSKLLEKLYNEAIDLGTYQFALYYKDWLAEGVEAPPIPEIKIPSLTARITQNGGSCGQTSSPASYASPRAMVSKKLYDEVFRHSHGPEMKVHEEDNFVRSGSWESPATEDKQLILYSREPDTFASQNSEPDGESLPDDLCLAKEGKQETSSRESSIDEIHRESRWQQIEETVDHFALTCLPNSTDAAFLVQQTESDPLEDVQENSEEFGEKLPLFTIPEDFICPLTGLLFEDPVTLETGQTFEREAIINWFDNGCITCPVTTKTLLCQAVPNTNLILKRVIDNWKTEHYRKLSDIVSQASGDKMIIFSLEKLLAVLTEDEGLLNARRVISLGGLQFLLTRFHCGDAREKAYILPLLTICIKADADCRRFISSNINKMILMELLHIEQTKLKTNAVLLLIELICFNRRNSSKSFLESLKMEEIAKAMDDLLIYLETSKLEDKPMIAVLLLHLDLLSEPQVNDMYRHEAVDALTISLDMSLSDEKVQTKCSRALLVLGGCFSSSGKVMTEDWILKLSGFLNGPDWDISITEDEAIAAYTNRARSAAEDGEEEQARENWLMSVSVSLIGDGKRSFLDTISKCLSLGNPDMVRVCLTTVAWLSSSLASLSETGTELQLYAFSALISPLKNCLDNGELVEHRILASFSLLNFSKVPECKVLLKNIAEEIINSVEKLVDVTWTATELRTIISGRR